VCSLSSTQKKTKKGEGNSVLGLTIVVITQLGGIGLAAAFGNWEAFHGSTADQAKVWFISNVPWFV
jgi:hypothetical protein